MALPKLTGPGRTDASASSNRWHALASPTLTAQITYGIVGSHVGDLHRGAAMEPAAADGSPRDEGAFDGMATWPIGGPELGGPERRLGFAHKDEE